MVIAGNEAMVIAGDEAIVIVGNEAMVIVGNEAMVLVANEAMVLVEHEATVLVEFFFFVSPGSAVRPCEMFRSVRPNFFYHLIEAGAPRSVRSRAPASIKCYPAADRRRPSVRKFRGRNLLHFVVNSGQNLLHRKIYSLKYQKQGIEEKEYKKLQHFLSR